MAAFRVLRMRSRLEDAHGDAGGSNRRDILAIDVSVVYGKVTAA